MIAGEKYSSNFGSAAAPAGREVPIGIVAVRSGCGIETIRFYEKAGVLPRARRAENGRRVYDNRDVARITFIRRARELGFSLSEVRGLLALAEGNGGKPPVKFTSDPTSLSLKQSEHETA
ncbi:MAG: hypothetical protein B7Z57_14470 [Acidiphilium sp. 37-60-79]|nr:MAG: hypothetical protein B7Z57_14470 [Acidiphilium sp. 37-60-79]